MKVARSALQKQKQADADHEAAQMRSLAVKTTYVVSRPTIDVEKIAEDVAALDPARRHRDPREAVFHFRTRDFNRIRASIVNYAYKRYAVPAHLEAVWYDRGPLLSPRALNPNRPAINVARNDLRRERMVGYYLTVASGGSLFKEHTKLFLSRKETHRFLTAPRMDFEAAIIFAIAGSFTEDRATCHRLSQSKIAQYNLIIDIHTSLFEDARSLFWRDVIRFFSALRLTLPEMNDLIDFFAHVRALNPEYSLKGRTATSVQTAMEQWHRTLARAKRMGNHTWKGVTLPDTIYEKEKNFAGNLIDYSISQILTSKALAAEGSAMHHCVYSYQTACISGRTSIWSLRNRMHKTKGPALDFERRITFELNNDQEVIVQIRGFANRTATGEEMAIIRKFAAENGLGVGGR